MGKLKKFFLLIFPLFVQGSSLFAQQDSIQNPIQLKRGFFEDISFTDGNFSKLNSILTQHGFLPLNQSYSGMSIGISARPTNKDSYVTAKLFAYKASSLNLANGKGVTMWSFGLHDEWHLDLVKDSRWRLGPDLGFGFSGVTLTLFEQSPSISSFSSSVANLGSPSKNKYSSLSLFMTGGVGADRRLRTKRFDFYLGFAVGYRLGTPVSFQQKYIAYSDSPQVGLGGLQYIIRIRMEPRKLIAASIKKPREAYQKFY